MAKDVFNFWVKNAFEPMYMSLKKNDTTGEYSCILVKSLGDEDTNSLTHAMT
jgi:N-acetyltransferase 10